MDRLQTCISSSTVFHKFCDHIAAPGLRAGRRSAGTPTATSMAVLMIGCLFVTYSAEAGDPDPAGRLKQAIALYDSQDYAEAKALLSELDPTALSDSAGEQFEKYRNLTDVAMAGASEARDKYNQARGAVRNRQLADAKELLAEVIDNPYVPTDLKISARARLARVALLERRQSRNPAPSPQNTPVRSPSLFTVHTDPLDRAREFVRLGSDAVRRRDYFKAQEHFNEAVMLVPDAPLEEIVVLVPAWMNVSHMPVTQVEEVHLVAPRRRVTMNMQFGVGRLLGVQSFQFAGGLRSGVGAPGFVQLPNISRTQIKTTATASASSIGGGRTFTFVQDYLVLFKPRLDPPKPITP
ncbi:MAG: hypothetical protein IID34_06800 [Planctomycetes bacterium]|nr:hypothetical protein [Planctomycetota bacterium]